MEALESLRRRRDEIIENDRFLILEGFERNCKEFFVYFVKRGDLKKMS